MSLLQLLASAVTRCDPSTLRCLLQATGKQAPQLFDHEDDKWFQHVLYCEEEPYHPDAYPMSFFNHLVLVSIIECRLPASHVGPHGGEPSVNKSSSAHHSSPANSQHRLHHGHHSTHPSALSVVAVPPSLDRTHDSRLLHLDHLSVEPPLLPDLPGPGPASAPAPSLAIPPHVRNARFAALERIESGLSNDSDRPAGTGAPASEHSGSVRGTGKQRAPLGGGILPTGCPFMAHNNTPGGGGGRSSAPTSQRGAGSRPPSAPGSTEKLSSSGNVSATHGGHAHHATAAPSSRRTSITPAHAIKVAEVLERVSASIDDVSGSKASLKIAAGAGLFASLQRKPASRVVLGDAADEPSIPLTPRSPTPSGIDGPGETLLVLKSSMAKTSGVTLKSAAQQDGSAVDPESAQGSTLGLARGPPTPRRHGSHASAQTAAAATSVELGWTCRVVVWCIFVAATIAVAIAASVQAGQLARR
ncbi:hypothetical protein H9P43_004043 [Blastocladiella emersonii ATCC 22665]|nr:hypothetical protein H9P43_004043 [Blastocladiella emersonii ATCC 22665]